MKFKRCPFCGGKLIYTRMNTDIRQPEIIQCLDDCGMEIMNEDRKDPRKLIQYIEIEVIND